MALVSVNTAGDDIRPPYRPARMLVVELTRELPVLRGGLTRDGVPYGTARTLVTLHDEPLGLLVSDLTGGEVSADALARGIYAELGADIDRHLRDDGLQGSWVLGPEGLTTSEASPCRAFDTDASGMVSVVLSTTGDPDRLERSLESLLASEYHSFEVMVVDRGSPADGTKAVVDEHHRADGRVRYLPAYHETRSGARNAAFGLSRGQFVAFTDEGCEPAPGWIGAIAATFDRHPDVASIVGPILTAELDTPPQLAFESINAVTGGWQRRVMDGLGSASGPGDRPFLADLYGSGDNIAVQKDLLDDLWGFDPHLGPSSPAGAADDLDVLVGLLADGQKIVFEPRALVWRRHPSDVATVRTLMRDRSVGLGAMLTKQMLTGRPRRREVLTQIAPLSTTIEPSASGPRLAHLASGSLAYMRSRVKRSWATA